MTVLRLLLTPSHMHGFHTNIERATKDNTDFRRVLYTSRYMQLVLMSLKKGQDIGNEVHGLDQFIRIEEGTAKAVLNNGETTYDMATDDVVVVPAGTYHNIINTGEGELKLYTVYAPPDHRDGVVEHTKADVVEEQFDGKTSE